MKITLTALIIVLLSFNIHAQWQINNGAPSSYFKDVIQRNDTLYMANLNSGIYKSVNGGTNWQNINNGLNSIQALSVYQVLLTGNILYAATVDGIYKSTDKGANWVKKSNGIVVGSGALYEFCESVFEHNGNLFTGAWTGIYSSSNAGESWLQTNVTGSGIKAKNFTLHNGILFAARESINNPIGYKSTDNGSTWMPLTFNYPTITFLSEPGKLWTGTIHGVWLSTNDGIDWINRSSGLSPDPYNSSFVRVGNVLVSSVKFGGSGIFKTTNEGLNWVEISEGLPFLSSIEKLIIYNGKILAATSSGLYHRNINELITGIENTYGNIPSEFALYQNYPNPFNPSTTISYSLLEAGLVKLIILDMLGQTVATLVSEFQKAGNYELSFDAANLPSGVYTYRISSGSYADTKKMILIK